MSKLRSVLALFILAGLLAGVGSATPAAAQDCARVISGNTNSPCKKVDYLAGLQAPTFTIERAVDSAGDYYCRPIIEFRSTTPLSADDLHKGDYRWNALLHNEDQERFWYTPGYSRGLHSGPEVHTDRIRFDFHEPSLGQIHGIKLTDPVPDTPPRIENYLRVQLYLSPQGIGRHYQVDSRVFPRPAEINDYPLLMNQCLADIQRQLEHEAALETARQQAEADRVAAETAAAEAANAAEIADIELKSAQAALAAQEARNAALRKETILAIQREDTIRAAWQQVILVRTAGLEERTRLWTAAVERWAAADLQFSTAMAARIQEVERLQALNAALEQSMTDQRNLLIAQLEDLERAEREAIAARTPATEPVPATAGAGAGQ